MMCNQKLQIAEQNEQSRRRKHLIPDRIERETLIDAPREVVWDVITDPAHVANWFADEVELETTPGAPGALIFHGHGTSRIQVERAERPRLFSWRWSQVDGEEPGAGTSTLVEFTLTEEDGRTRLVIAESGILEIDWDEERKRAFLEEHAGGWEHHLGRIGPYAAQVAAAR